MQIIADYEQSALNAPQSFRDGIQAAINILDSIFSTPITVRILVGYGDFNGTALTNQNFSEGGFNGGTFINYTTLRTDLIANSPIDGNSASLPNAASVNGHSSFIISPAQERIFGILPAVNNTATDDGIIGMGTNFTGNVLISGALHEITHALGRVNASSLDIFRFTSVGNRLFTGGSTAVPAYFSMDNGVTDIADFGQTSDPGDFLNGFRTPNDPFNEFVGNLANLTSTDIEIMEAIGFRAGTAPVTFVPNDFYGDGRADVLWRSGAGVAIWQMNGTSVSGAYVTSGGSMVNPDSSWAVVGVSTLNNDGKADVLWRNTSGALSDWTMNGSVITNSAFVTSGGAVVAPDFSWSVVGTGDFNHDGAGDILWRNLNGTTAIWFMNGSAIASSSSLFSNGVAVNPDPSWSVAGIGDFNGDGTADILWRNLASGATSMWAVNGTNIVSSASLTSGSTAVNPDPSWSVAGIGDFNGDNIADILWRNANGSLSEWIMNGSAIVGTGAPTSNGVTVSPDASWHVVEVGDFNGDHRSDVLWRNNNGLVVEWLMSGTQITTSTSLANPDASWTVQNKPADFA